ncbi:MAG TPA: isoprenylcysteine carboxylmethyltransferase family protein [Anaerolinea sp.]|nr:isoprenylcysteine carboxylmethyltransferase family protein [Anaerolinea sp.]
MQNTGFWWMILAVAVYGALHSLLASHAAKGWAERQFGENARRFYRLFFVVFALITSPVLLILVLVLPDRPLYTIPMPWVLLTLSLQGLALFGLNAAVGQTGSAAFLGLQQISHPVPLRSRAGPEQLATGGLYRYVRHPIYTTTFVLIWLIPVVTWNIFGLMLGFTIYTFIGTLFEERKLREEFGEAYEAYRRKTPMVIPFIGSRRT